jgi:hypothetical protein
VHRGAPIVQSGLAVNGMPEGPSEAAVRALQLPMGDEEDALQASSALAFNADYIISRNVKDYRRPPVPAIAPKEFNPKTRTP